MPARRQQQLRFRRHLALVGFLLILVELQTKFNSLANSGGSGGGRFVGAATTSTSTTTGQQQQAELQLNKQNWIAAAEVQDGDHDDVGDGDDDDDRGSIEKVLDYIGEKLPTLNFNYSIGSFADRIHQSVDDSGATPIQGSRPILREKLDAEVERYYERQFPAHMSHDQLQLASIKAAFRTAPIPLHSSWHYATDTELKQSIGPTGNRSRCRSQLAHLADRLDRIMMSPVVLNAGDEIRAAHEGTPLENFDAKRVFETQDLEFIELMDTFGRVPSDFLRGNNKWFGSYASCLRSNVRMTTSTTNKKNSNGKVNNNNNNKNIKFRYCLAAFKSSGWMKTNTSEEMVPIHNYDRLASKKAGNFFIRIGTCLPRACDSRAPEESELNRLNLEKLIKFNLAKPFNGNHYYLADLYCLPDTHLDSNPFKQLTFMSWTLLALATVWLVVIFVATSIHLNVDRFYRKMAKQIRSGASSSSSDHLQEGERDLFGLKYNYIRLNVYLRDKSSQLIQGVDLVDCLSLYSNWLRFTNRLKRAIVSSHEREQREAKQRILRQQLVRDRKLKGCSLEIQINRQSPSSELQGIDSDIDDDDDDDKHRQSRVNTNSLNALKVIALVWIISGHCLFYLASAASNLNNFAYYVRHLTVFALNNGAIYITELFFIISGCLTAYLAFKHNTKIRRQQMSGKQVLVLERRMFSMAFWVKILAHRYLRILPTYLLVYCFVRLISLKLGGSGPLWDYAVSENSVRRACSQESWLPVLTLTSNFVDIYGHCIVGGWYLSTDVQFLLAGIPLLFLLGRASLRGTGSGSGHQSQAVGLTKLQQYNNNYNNSNSNSNSNNNISSSETETRTRNNTTTTNTTTDISSKRKSEMEMMDFQQQHQHQHNHQTGTGTMPVAGNGTGTGADDSNIHNNHHHEVALDNNMIMMAKPQRRLMVAYGTTLFLALCSAFLAMFYMLLYSRSDFSYILKFLPHTMAILSDNIELYTNPVLRFRAFALGLLLGHLLYLYEMRIIELPKIIRQHGTKLFIVMFLGGFCTMFIAPIYPKGKLLVSHESTIVLAMLSCTGLDLFLCAVIFFLCIGKAPKAALFLFESPFWTIPSTLSLCAFLVHSELIILLTGQLSPPPDCQYSLMLFFLCATLLLTYSIAVGLYLAFELPFARLVTSLLVASSSSSNSITSPGREKEREGEGATSYLAGNSTKATSTSASASEAKMST